MFQEVLQFKDVTIFCCSKQNIVRISGRVPPLLIWLISKTIVDSLSLIVTTCVLNQSRSHWLFYDPSQSTITIYLKFKEEITNPSALISLIDDDSRITFELSFVCFQHQRSSLWCFGFFSFF